MSVVLLLLTACGSDGGDSAPAPQVLNQEATFPYTVSDKDIVLNGFNGTISSITGTTDWCKVEQKASASTLTVVFHVDENVTLSERKCVIAVTTSSGDKLTLKVTQQAHPAETNTGVDDSHDNPTDQPAYSPRR